MKIDTLAKHHSIHTWEVRLVGYHLLRTRSCRNSPHCNPARRSQPPNIPLQWHEDFSEGWASLPPLSKIVHWKLPPSRELQMSYGKTVIFAVGCCTRARDRLLLGQPTCLVIEGRHPVSGSSPWQMPREDVNDRKACSDTTPEIPETSSTKDTISIFKVDFSFTTVCKTNCVKKHTLLFYKLFWYFNLIVPHIMTAPSSPLLCHPRCHRAWRPIPAVWSLSTWCFVQKLLWFFVLLCLKSGALWKRPPPRKSREDHGW